MTVSADTTAGDEPPAVAAIRTGSASSMPAADHRDRLVVAMAELLAEQGYASVTVTDVVARARVSKRTFYQHFTDREECLLATYRVVAEGPLHMIAQAAESAAGSGLSLREEIASVTGAYLAAMAEHPLLTRAMLTEPGSTGPAGRSARREVMRRFADQLVALAAGVGSRSGGRPLPPALAQALVGGINELVLAAVESADREGVAPADIAAEILALRDTVTDLAVAVLARRD
ncbi:TetR/AcrR family transcriptional regulator [Actinomycetospora endophytica]|uniref:TetR/AcrR family transcriptional regulator n=1 Tax=Actinomycetospora endophytica TaxID=2291215 RepID=A0ABS8P5V7_9PSEU|nr:TetR/AcrR family transcriptional regulator [Actinomycetospora endophytica]MCD2193408.1 TetR/AcrR family transcriptional regulator [Actinomycetospora endophytica]